MAAVETPPQIACVEEVVAQTMESCAEKSGSRIKLRKVSDVPALFSNETENETDAITETTEVDSDCDTEKSEPLPKKRKYSRRKLKKKKLFTKGQVLAVRSDEDEFWLCQAKDNVYETNETFPIRWYNSEGNDKDYVIGAADTTELECVIAPVTLERRVVYSIAESEKKRIMNLVSQAKQATDSNSEEQRKDLKPKVRLDTVVNGKRNGKGSKRGRVAATRVNGEEIVKDVRIFIEPLIVPKELQDTIHCNLKLESATGVIREEPVNDSKLVIDVHEASVSNNSTVVLSVKEDCNEFKPTAEVINDVVHDSNEVTECTETTAEVGAVEDTSSEVIWEDTRSDFFIDDSRPEVNVGNTKFEVNVVDAKSQANVDDSTPLQELSVFTNIEDLQSAEKTSIASLTDANGNNISIINHSNAEVSSASVVGVLESRE